MAIGFGVACPKPKPRLVDRVEKKRDYDKRAQAFRQAVWTRDEHKCRVCGCRCLRTSMLHPKRGEVHHIAARNVAPEKRLDPSNGILLCLEHHIQVQRYEIPCPRNIP